MKDMRKNRFTEQQIIDLLKQAETGLAVKEVCRQNKFPEPTLYKWRALVRYHLLYLQLGTTNHPPLMQDQ
ncbi:hypothetical protein C8244_07510 [Paracidovorax avenae]|nr:hypothetical protein C8243_15105 [Paracidovorax avenae]AVT10562.1 hypothetical protein C8242_14570 [Paracidovorax avenae]AVT16079.1 hypothetical protein C8244_07510 [Paracidovorax avenae]